MKDMLGLSPNYVALFIDYENVFHYLSNRLVDENRTQEVTLELIRTVRDHIEKDSNRRVIIQHAYADFEQLEVSPMGDLYLIGVETHNVVGTDHKNAADMRLCIDVMETLYTRKEIGTFLFMAGDRDYIPVIQHLKKHAKEVFAVAFKDNISGDLLMNVGKGYVDAFTLLGKVSQSELEVGEERRREERHQRNQQAEAVAVEKQRVVAEEYRPPEVAFAKPQRLFNQDAVEALEILLTNYGEKPEVFISPYLNKLRQAMQHLAEYERKAVISTMVEYGAVKIEKRRGDPFDYSVLIVNWNHPDVREMNPLGK